MDFSNRRPAGKLRTHRALSLRRWMVLVFALFLGQSASAAITFKFATWNTYGNMPTIDAGLYQPIQTGDLIVVIIGWWDTTSSVTSVTDTMGNTYIRAVGPTVSTDNASQSLYYAVANGAAANAFVTVTFNNASVPAADLRISHYSGVDPVNPFVGAVGATGNGTSLNSGSLSSVPANALLVAGNYIEQYLTSVGSGFTTRDTTDLSHFIADKIVTSAGTYNATATQDACCFWILQMAAFNPSLGGGGDTTPPSAPTNFSATPASSTQINLSWTASTDNVGVTGYKVERCTGASCSNFAEIATPTGTTHNDTGLTASTTYRYRVRARDAANNLSGYSSIVNATTSSSDTQAPTAPSGLGATVVSSTQVNLSWTASTDNVGVTGYKVERCTGASCSNFAEIATPTGTTHNNTGLTASTTYRYRVRATDAANNLSAYSSIVNATTSASDTQAPTAPSGLGATVVSSTQLNLSWTASSDNVGVTGYRVESCQGASCSNFVEIGTPTGTSFNNTGLTASTTYRYRVRATDAANNLSSYSSTVNATTQAALAPPTALIVTAKSNKEIDIAWTASTSPGVTGYLIERCSGTSCSNFSQLGSSTPNLFLYDPALTAATSYSYRIRATNGSSQSSYSTVLTTTTLTAVSCD